MSTDNLPSGERIMNFGTERCRELLDRLSSPDDSLKIIHIAGTNGKGSICEYFTQVLIEMGERVGTFTSPEVYSYYDQFKINGREMDGDKFLSYLQEVKAVSEGVEATPFELETATAIYAFYREGCKWAVIECGMGGAVDSTNAINKKELAVISSISLEHTKYLGGSISEICTQKAGIIKGKCVVNCLQTDEGLEYFKGLDVKIADMPTLCSSGFIYGGERYEIGLLGREQICNAATVVEGCLQLGFPKDVIKKGLKNAKILGRREHIYAGQHYILDGGHNPQSLHFLAEYLSGKKFDLLYGCLSDKDIAANFEELRKVSDKIALVECPSYRAMPLESMRKFAGIFKEVRTFDSVERALSNLTKDTVVICGSFTLLKEARAWIEKRQ